MTASITPKRGEIWWVKLPNQPDDKHQPRTAIIVSTDRRNAMASDVVVVPTFSNIRDHPCHVSIPSKAGGLPHESVAKCEQVSTISKKLLAAGPLGPPLDKTLMDQIVIAIRLGIGDLVLP